MGQTLNIPTKVSTIGNNATTFKPYDPSRITGDTSPTMAMPQAQKGGCGAIGTILMVVVAVAVTVMTSGVAATATGSAFAGGLIGGAAGAVASQAVGIAIGQQEGFNWKSVALAAISNGITQGVAPQMLEGTWAAENVMVRAAMANSITQGIGITTGLQKSFNWKSVAASAIGAGVGQVVGQALQDSSAFSGLGKFTASVARGTVAGIAAGTAASIARGGRIAVQQVAADAFGNALGNSLAYASQPSTPLQGVGPGSDYGYRNGSDIQSDNAYYDRVTQQAIADSRYSITDTSSDRDVLDYSLRQQGYGSDWSLSQVDFRRNNGEYVAESAPRAFVGEKRLVDDAPTIPTSLLPQGVDPATVFAMRDDTGLFYTMRMPGGMDSAKSADLFFNSARSVIDQGQAGLDSGAITPSQYLEAARFLDNSGQSLMQPSLANQSTGPVVSPSPYGSYGVGQFVHDVATGAIDGAVGAVTQPIMQAGDLLRAGTSFVYNEAITPFTGGKKWFPELKSGVAQSYAQGASQVKLLAGAIPIVNVGVFSYDTTTALLEGRTKDAAQALGGVLGSAAVGGVVNRYGNYGLDVSFGGIGSTLGNVKFSLVHPNLVGSGTVLARNMGGLDVGYQAHHLIMSKLAHTSKALSYLAENGLYDVNRASNGRAYPGNPLLAADTGLPLHSGYHGPVYRNAVTQELRALDQYQARGVSDVALLNRVSSIEQKLASSLASGKLWLNKSDAYYRQIGDFAP